MKSQSNQIITISTNEEYPNANFKFNQCLAVLVQEQMPTSKVFLNPETLDIVVYTSSLEAQRLPLVVSALIQKLRTPVVLTNLYKIGVTDTTFRFLIKPRLLKFLESYYKKIKNTKI